MRRALLILISLVSVLAVPVASAADKPEKPDNAAAAATGSADAARAVSVTATRVTLQAAVVPGDAGSTATFEYGPTTDYGFTAAASPARSRAAARARLPRSTA
jgi:hypothetical protein